MSETRKINNSGLGRLFIVNIVKLDIYIIINYFDTNIYKLYIYIYGEYIYKYYTVYVNMYTKSILVYNNSIYICTDKIG